MRSETDKFGFSHCSGKKEYFKAAEAMPAFSVPESSQALGVSENATDVAGPEAMGKLGIRRAASKKL